VLADALVVRSRIASQPTESLVRYAQRALAIGEALGRDDLRAQALYYVGSGRLSLGDPRGADDRGLALRSPGSKSGSAAMSTPPAVRTRWGRFADARRYIAEGLRLAADGEFADDEYPAPPDLSGDLGQRRRVGRRDRRAAGAGGPQPPKGDAPHRYVFRLYALAEHPRLPSKPSAGDVHRAVDGHELASGTLVGRFAR
jgi:hypothetical protein